MLLIRTFWRFSLTPPPPARAFPGHLPLYLTRGGEWRFGLDLFVLLVFFFNSCVNFSLFWEDRTSHLWANGANSLNGFNQLIKVCKAWIVVDWSWKFLLQQRLKLQVLMLTLKWSPSNFWNWNGKRNSIWQIGPNGIFCSICPNKGIK